MAAEFPAFGVVLMVATIGVIITLGVMYYCFKRQNQKASRMHSVLLKHAILEAEVVKQFGNTPDQQQKNSEPPRAPVDYYAQSTSTRPASGDSDAVPNDNAFYEVTSDDPYSVSQIVDARGAVQGVLVGGGGGEGLSWSSVPVADQVNDLVQQDVEQTHILQVNEVAEDGSKQMDSSSNSRRVFDTGHDATNDFSKSKSKNDRRKDAPDRLANSNFELGEKQLTLVDESGEIFRTLPKKKHPNLLRSPPFSHSVDNSSPRPKKKSLPKFRLPGKLSGSDGMLGRPGAKKSELNKVLLSPTERKVKRHLQAASVSSSAPGQTPDRPVQYALPSKKKSHWRASSNPSMTTLEEIPAETSSPQAPWSQKTQTSHALPTPLQTHPITADGLIDNLDTPTSDSRQAASSGGSTDSGNANGEDLLPNGEDSIFQLDSPPHYD